MSFTIVPKHSGSEEDQVDVVEVQSEGKNHHAYKRQAVHNQSGHPVKQQHKRNKQNVLLLCTNLNYISMISMYHQLRLSMYHPFMT